MSTHLSSRSTALWCPFVGTRGASPPSAPRDGDSQRGRVHESGPWTPGLSLRVGALGAGQASVLRSGPGCPVSGRSGQSRAPRPLEVARQSEVTCRSVSTPGFAQGGYVGPVIPRDPVSSLQPPCRGYTCPVAPGWGAETGEGPGHPTWRWGWRGRGSMLLKPERTDEPGRLRPGTWALPVLAAPRALPVPVLRRLGTSPCWPRAHQRSTHTCSPRCPQLQLQRPRSWPLGGCLAAGSPLFSRTPAPPPARSPSERSPQGSAKPWAQAAGPGDADQAPFQESPIPAPVLRLELGQSPQDLASPRPRRGASRRQTRVTT